MNKPLYADFIIERFQEGTTGWTLANFGTKTMQGTMWYNSASHSISEPYGNGWFFRDNMVNRNNKNVDVGPVSLGTFQLKWLTSAGT